MKVKLFLVLLLFVLTSITGINGCYGQENGTKAETAKQQLIFKAGSSTLTAGYMGNGEVLEKFSKILSSTVSPYIESITIKGYASPEGSQDFNMTLSQARADAVRSYIETSYPWISADKIRAKGMGENWDGLRDLIEADYATPRRSELLHIIDNVPEEINYKTNTFRKKSVMELGPEPWNYMMKNHFPQLRAGVPMATRLTYKEAYEMVGLKKEEPESEHVIAEQEQEQKQPQVAEQPQKDMLITETPQVEWIKEFPFAVKTNLLFDLASALNVEVEVPIGKRWSIAGEWIFPWWLWEKKQYCLQVLSGNIEGRYWFGDRTGRPLMTGWFTGLYAGGGLYDIGWDDKGYQGEFFIAAGLSAGYAHTINKSGTFRMEYSLGIGYMQTQYKEYTPKMGVDDKWHLIRRQNGSYTWIGPTRAKISLVWMLNCNLKKGGVK